MPESDAAAHLLRGPPRRRDARLRLARDRRGHRFEPLLHLGHDRQPQGRALLAPLHRAAQLRGVHARRLRPVGRRRRPARWCPCSTSTPGAFPYAAAMAGAKLVMPGPRLDGASLFELFESEGVTLTAGVPTIWLALLQHMEKNALTLSHAQARGDRRGRGAAGDDPRLPRAPRRRGAARLGHDGAEPARHREPLQGEARAPGTRRRATRCARSRAARSSASTCASSAPTAPPLPHDGTAFGDLQVRGHWVIDRYFSGAGGDVAATTAGSRPATSPPSTPTAT